GIVGVTTVFTIIRTIGDFQLADAIIIVKHVGAGGIGETGAAIGQIVSVKRGIQYRVIVFCQKGESEPCVRVVAVRDVAGIRQQDFLDESGGQRVLVLVIKFACGRRDAVKPPGEIIRKLI